MWAGSFFGYSKLKCSDILHIGYLWLSGAPSQTIGVVTGHADDIIAAYTKYFRQLVTDSLNEESCMIGGNGMTVKINESKIACRKYHRCHYVEGAWIIGGVERSEDRRVFISRV